MKLKTLKDLEREELTQLYPKRIKEEAIKWVKESDVYLSVIHWKDFFNISEEDLK